MGRKRRRKRTEIHIDGVILKSKLERYCYSQLKESSIPFCYECKTFELLPALQLDFVCMEKYGRKLIKRKTVQNMVYTPDFVIDDKYYIETKGYFRPKDTITWKLFKHYIANNKKDFEIFMPRNDKQIDQVIEYIKTKRNGEER